MQCLYVAGTMTECPLRTCVHIREVSASRGFTVLVNTTFSPSIALSPSISSRSAWAC